jgi:hypothetical protein
VSKREDDEYFVMLSGFYDGEPENIASEVRERLRRGDFPSWWSRTRARLVLRKAERQARAKRRNSQEGLAERQTVAAERQAVAAYLALLISITSLVVAVLAYQKSG